MRLFTWLSAAALSAGLCTASFAQISGKVTLDGNPPDMPEVKGIAAVPQCAALHKDPVYEDTVIAGDKGELANVFVFIKPAEGQKIEGPQKTEPAVIDQKGCMYTPHVLAVEIGEPVLVKNSDPFLHNVHSLAIDNPTFNFAQVTTSEKKIQPFTAVETFHIKCDVHPWMNAVVRVFDNPYFTTTGEDGKYTIDTKGLKDGTYTVQAWHEVYRDSQPEQVEVKGGKATKEVDFKFKAKKAEAAPLKTLHLASLTATADCCSDAKPQHASVASTK
jgi:plastocyanin